MIYLSINKVVSWLVLCLWLLSSCNNKPSKVNTLNHLSASSFKTGKIEFTKELHNFGSLKAGEVVSFSFKFRNIGSKPFLLSKVEPTCGCLTVQYERAMIEPLDSSVVEVIFNSAGEWGNQIKTVEVETSSGDKNRLTVGAFIENENFNIDLNK